MVHRFHCRTMRKTQWTCLLMRDDLERWNKERGENEPQIKVGMGIHTGAAFAGNMGAEDRLNYTVVGMNVNLAARLCSAANPMQILVSADTYRSLVYQKNSISANWSPLCSRGLMFLCRFLKW